jgi:hypothetical protein
VLEEPETERGGHRHGNWRGEIPRQKSRRPAISRVRKRSARDQLGDVRERLTEVLGDRRRTPRSSAWLRTGQPSRGTTVGHPGEVDVVDRADVPGNREVKIGLPIMAVPQS